MGNVLRKEKGRQCAPLGERHSKAAHGQETQKVQQKRGVVRGKSG